MHHLDAASTAPNNFGESSFVQLIPHTKATQLAVTHFALTHTHKLCSKKHGYSLSQSVAHTMSSHAPLTLPYLLTLLFSLALFVRVVRLPRIRWPTPANTASAPTTTGRA